MYYIERKKARLKKRLKIIGVIIAAFVLVITIGMVIHKVEGHFRGGDITGYETGASSKVKEIAKHCDFDLDKVNKVKLLFYNARAQKIGYLENNYDYTSVYYMIYDTKEIEKLVEKIKNVKMYGIVEDEYKYYEDSTLDWEIKLYIDDMEYAMTFTGCAIEGEEDVEEFNVDIEHKDYPIKKEEYPNPHIKLLSSQSLVYGQDLHEYLYDLYERCVRNLTVEDILNIYDEGDYEKFFAYENDGGKGRSYEEKLEDSRNILRYTLRIDDFDGYVLVERQNESVTQEDGTEIVYTDVLDVKIYNNNGEYIDFMNSTRAEVEAFLK